MHKIQFILFIYCGLFFTSCLGVKVEDPELENKLHPQAQAHETIPSCLAFIEVKEGYYSRWVDNRTNARTLEENQKCLTSDRGVFTLIKKITPSVDGLSGTPREVWRDEKTQVYWGDFVIENSNFQFTHDEAIELCKTMKDPLSIGGLTSYQWRLPSMEEVEGATQHGVDEVFPRGTLLGQFFWTSTLSEDHVAALVFGFDNSGTWSLNQRSPLDSKNFVRCVMK